MPGPGRRFRKGEGGRKRGAKDKGPRLAVIRAAYEELRSLNPARFRDVIDKGLDGKNAFGFVELAAKVYKEIGPGSDDGPEPVRIELVVKE